ncbi:MAG: SUMF1/EgtB/PvdO family nonheme iron enzyme, partial [Planctomycetota bacterium]
TDLREIDPTGPAAGPERVSRGGSWAAGPAYCRSARRSWGDPSFALADHGFRVVVEAIPVVAPVAVQPAIAALPKELALDLGGGVKMDMLLVPAGEFVMGSNDGPPEEKPVHNVKVSKPFYIGKYHVTVAQFRAFADGTKYRTEAEKCGKGQTWKDGGWKEVAGVNWQTPGFPQEDNFPACVITWNDAQEFCKWATERTAGVSPALEKAGGTPAVRKWTVCLPTEAQWEYACRAGTTTRYNSGDKDSDLEQEGWFNNNSGRHTNACGLKKPNAWGLYDMHGNVWQWVQDFFNDKYYTESPLLDPKGPANGAERVLRGGAWDDRPDNCRASRRHRDIPGGRYTSRGFRLALDF